jgi:leader peptidase (prepilin peptidase) / N-methyltransferase
VPLSGFCATAAPIVGFAALFAQGAGTIECLIAALLAGLAARIALIDLRSFTLPDLELLLFGALGLGWLAYDSSGDLDRIAAGMARSASYAALFWSVRYVYAARRGRQGLGFGDVKLAAASGPWLDLSAFAATLILSAVLGFALTAARSVAKRRPWRWTAALPFGTLFSVALSVVWMMSYSP